MSRPLLDSEEKFEKEVEWNLNLLDHACYEELQGERDNGLMMLTGLYKFSSMTSVAKSKHFKTPRFCKNI
jgi:hypothetical protein